MVGKRQKSYSGRRWMASLLLHHSGNMRKRRLVSYLRQLNDSAHLQREERWRRSPGVSLVARRRVSLWGGGPLSVESINKLDVLSPY